MDVSRFGVWRAELLVDDIDDEGINEQGVELIELKNVEEPSIGNGESLGHWQTEYLQRPLIRGLMPSS